MKFGPMKPQRRNRLLLVLFVVLAAASAVGLALSALNENMNLFYSPGQITAGEAPTGVVIRAGGMVVAGSVLRATESLRVDFVISDLQGADVNVSFTGILPDLFREGQGVIARGILGRDGNFVAEEVLAKHDETYMPPELVDVLPDSHNDPETFKGGTRQ